MAHNRSFAIDILSLPRHYSPYKTTFYAIVSIVTPSSVTSEKAILGKAFKRTLKWQLYRDVLRFDVKESKIQDMSAKLMIELRSRRTFMMDVEIGHVRHIPLKELLDKTNADDKGSAHFHLIGKDNKPEGQILCFDYQFGRPVGEGRLIISSSSSSSSSEGEDEDEEDEEEDESEDDWP